ncbi:MAG: adenylate/guanylate cyclase domain-containing protein, partial [Mycobacterium sp.]
MRPRRLLIRYAAGLTSAYVLTVAEVVAIVVSLIGPSVVTPGNVIALVALSVVGTIAVATAAALIIAPSLQWVSAGLTPTDAQLSSATKTTRRQSAITVAPWALAAAVLVPLNLDADPAVLTVIVSAILFGAIANVCTGFLFTLRTLRPLLAGVPVDLRHPVAPGVRARLLLMWTVCTALPGLA